MIAGPEILVEPLRKFKVNKGEHMKVLKIEPKDRLTEYTHIEIQGITIPLSSIHSCKNEKDVVVILTYGTNGHNALSLILRDEESALSIVKQVRDEVNRYNSSLLYNVNTQKYWSTQPTCKRQKLD